jgi:hypothetical protein
MSSRATLLAALAVAGVAHADPPAAAPRPAKPATTAAAQAATPAATAASSDAPDPAVAEAGEANLELTEPRRGLTFSGAIGGGLVIGFGIKDSVGRGGSLSLRLGHGATRRTVITFELGITAALHKQGTNNAIETNTNSNLLAGAQYYVNTSLWVRFGGGLGVYQGRQVALSAGVGNLTLVGPAALAGVGLELWRVRSAVLDFEIGTSAMLNSQGVLVASGANLGLSFD